MSRTFRYVPYSLISCTFRTPCTLVCPYISYILYFHTFTTFRIPCTFRTSCTFVYPAIFVKSFIFVHPVLALNFSVLLAVLDSALFIFFFFVFPLFCVLLLPQGVCLVRFHSNPFPLFYKTSPRVSVSPVSLHVTLSFYSNVLPLRTNQRLQPTPQNADWYSQCSKQI